LDLRLEIYKNRPISATWVPTQVTALLVSITAVEPLRLWIRFRALDPGAAWNLHLVLLAAILVTAVTLWLRPDKAVG
jgi:hypothetical protein